MANEIQQQFNILLIKTGYSETLDSEVGSTVSLGDVLRTTPLLHLYKNDAVTWLTDEKAVPLLKNNPYIKNVLTYNLDSILQIQHTKYDIIINLEKAPGLCALVSSMRAWRKYGFGFDNNTGTCESHGNAEEAYGVCKDEKKKVENKKTWQEMLFNIIGTKFEEQDYVLAKPNNNEFIDIGLNFQTGNKWQNKKWEFSKWQTLEALLVKLNKKISWQPKTTNIEDYIQWINSCKTIITCDSLGLHIALALRKRVIALFGPTKATEVYMYGKGQKIVSHRTCVPCLRPICKYGTTACMSDITPGFIVKTLATF